MLDTLSNEIHNQKFDFDLLISSAQEVIRLAQYEAIKMNAPEIYPEHLFLGSLRLEDVEVTQVLRYVGFDKQKIQAQVTEIFGKLDYEDSDHALNLSNESLACFEWAISFATQMNSSMIHPKHLILGVLRHPRIQPLLVLLLPLQNQEVLPAPLEEVDGHAYTSYIDQLVHSRVREQSVIKSNHSPLKRVFKWFERPCTTFGDIQGLDVAKDELRKVVDFLKNPQYYQQSRRTYLYGALLIGHPCTDRTLLVKAIAGEAVVPLICLSLSTLVEMLNDLNSDVDSLDDLDLQGGEYEIFANYEPSLRGRMMVAHIFSQAKMLSPCVLFFDNLDAVNLLPTRQEREQLLNQFVIEMDGLDNHPQMAVIVSTKHNHHIDQALVHPGRFEHQVVMSSSIMAHPVAQTKLCISCKYEVLATWKYCVYCGASIAQTCPQCGTLLIQLEGARFCSECGTSQRNTQSI
jgi:ATPase family associated with various cellular activities (AAA)/Double zinc ribbon/Clp amino terminal domain, pathogenicity island component